MVTHLSRMLINDEVDENSTVYIDTKPGAHSLTYKVERNGGLVNSTTGAKSDILIKIPNTNMKEAKKMKIDEVDADADEDMEDDL